jgi:hypothetical protein
MSLCLMEFKIYYEKEKDIWATRKLTIPVKSLLSLRLSHSFLIELWFDNNRTNSLVKKYLKHLYFIFFHFKMFYLRSSYWVITQFCWYYTTIFNSALISKKQTTNIWIFFIILKHLINIVQSSLKSSQITFNSISNYQKNGHLNAEKTTTPKESPSAPRWASGHG